MSAGQLPNTIAKSPPPLLHGKVALVTGAAQGIGAATARLFASHGAHVVVSDIDAAKADAVVAGIVGEGGTAIAIAGDLTQPSFINLLIDTTVGHFGALHYLVNNAGFTWDGMLHKMGDQQWEAIQTIHLTVPFRLIRAAAPHMRGAGLKEREATGQSTDRCVINVSSVNGTHGNVGQANYSAAKAGLIGLTKTVCKEWGKAGVRCNAVAFGYIDTRLLRPKSEGHVVLVEGEPVAVGMPDIMPVHAAAADLNPLGRIGTATEAAGAILLLCSPLATFINGQCLEVAGGSHL